MKTIVHWSRDNLILLNTLKTIVQWCEDNCPVLQFLWRRLSSAHYFVKTIFQCSYFLHFYHFLMKTIRQCFIFCEDNCTSAHVDNFTCEDNFTIPPNMVCPQLKSRPWFCVCIHVFLVTNWCQNFSKIYIKQIRKVWWLEFLWCKFWRNFGTICDEENIGTSIATRSLL